VLASDKGEFDVRWRALDAGGSVLSTSTATGTRYGRACAAEAEGSEDIAKLEITYRGDNGREVLRLLTMYPQRSTPPVVSVQPDPYPLRAGGNATLNVSTGEARGVDEAEVTVEQGSSELATRTCEDADDEAWLECPVDVNIPEDAGSLRISVRSTTEGTTRKSVHTVSTVSDQVPPLAKLVPQPMVVPPGSQSTVRVDAEDGSGVAKIDLEVATDDEELASPTCNPVTAPRTLDCSTTVTPPEDAFVSATATITDRAGNTVEMGPKPIPVRGPDDNGDRLPDDLEREIGKNPAPSDSDSDGDGFSDAWEVIGVDRNGDGSIELDLASLGADPLVRDVFVEEDWATTSQGSHEVTNGAIQMARNVLASEGTSCMSTRRPRPPRGTRRATITVTRPTERRPLAHARASSTT